MEAAALVEQLRDARSGLPAPVPVPLATRIEAALGQKGSASFDFDRVVPLLLCKPCALGEAAAVRLELLRLLGACERLWEGHGPVLISAAIQLLGRTTDDDGAAASDAGDVVQAVLSLLQALNTQDKILFESLKLLRAPDAKLVPRNGLRRVLDFISAERIEPLALQVLLTERAPGTSLRAHPLARRLHSRACALWICLTDVCVPVDPAAHEDAQRRCRAAGGPELQLVRVCDRKQVGTWAVPGCALQRPCCNHDWWAAPQ